MRRMSGVISRFAGLALIIGGITTWWVVSSTLADQKIFVADDAGCLAAKDVDGPFSAYCCGWVRA